MALTEANILLLGETGVGKSTFINAINYYSQFDSFDDACKSPLQYLIPTRFELNDGIYRLHEVGIGDDENENPTVGKSSTQSTREHVIRLKSSIIRVIDTPGIGDDKGIAQDMKNIENILSTLARYQKIHAICFLLHPSQTIMNTYWKFCITYLFSRLEKSAAENIIFIFPKTYGTRYKAGETLGNLRRVLRDDIFVNIPCEEDRNIFCFDNEAFRYFVARYNNCNDWDNDSINIYKGSWEKSSNEFWRWLFYILGYEGFSGLKPHDIQRTIRINRVKKSLIDLMEPLNNISVKLIPKNVEVIENHRKGLLGDITIEELRQKMYTPIVECVATPLEKPVMFCTSTSPKCKNAKGQEDSGQISSCGNIESDKLVEDSYMGRLSRHFKKLIHITGKCETCGCDLALHRAIAYTTKLEQKQIENQEVIEQIQLEEEKRKKISELERRCEEYKSEQDTILDCMAKFAHFFKENAMSHYTDSFGKYLDYLIQSPEVVGGQNKRQDYEEIKRRYEEEKTQLENLLKHNEEKDVSIEEINNCIKKLYELKHTGEQIKDLQGYQEEIMGDDLVFAGVENVV